METPVVFKSGEQQIVGMLHRPAKTKKKMPAVVFLHGFTGNKVESHRIFVKMARLLAEAGYASLRFDFRGLGDSEGDFSTMTVSSELQDAHAALRFMRRQRDIDPDNVALLGFSLGGMVASLAAAEDRKVKTVVLWSPVSDLPALIQKRMTSDAERQLQLMGCIDVNGWAVGKAFIDESDKYKPFQTLEKSKASVLLIHGEYDTSVPVSSSRNYAAALKKAGRRHALQLIAGSDHTFNSLQWETEALTVTLEWFRSEFGLG